MADKFVDRCGNCAFSRPVSDEVDKIECILGGSVSRPMSRNCLPCFCYRPSVREARRREPAVERERKRRSEAEPPRAEPQRQRPKVVTWTQERDEMLRTLYANSLNTLYDISRKLGLLKTDVINRLNEMGLTRRPGAHASKAKTVFSDGNNLPVSKQRYPRIKCCKGYCCKYKEQCAHYAHWLEMGKPQFDTINSVTSCINSPYNSGEVHTETLSTYREFLGLDMKSRDPDPITYSETV